MSTEKAYARCAACNRNFYPAWRQELGQFEDLCWSCMKVSQHTARVDPILYGSKMDTFTVNPDKWEQSTAEETNTYIRHLAEFGEMQHDSLLDEDEWTRCTGIDSGEWFGTDCPFDVYEV